MELYAFASNIIVLFNLYVYLYVMQSHANAIAWNDGFTHFDGIILFQNNWNWNAVP